MDTKIKFNDFKKRQQECVDRLLEGVPDVFSAKRETLEDVVKSAFYGGWTMHELASKVDDWTNNPKVD